MERRIPAGSRQAGVAYLAVLMAVAALGAGLALTGIVWHAASQREKEQELLFVGEQFRRAIQQYYESSPGDKRYPQSLDDLLLDKRHPGTRRYLRRVYRDPLVNSPNWVLIAAPQGGIMGVRSSASGTPIKQDGFGRAQAEFGGKLSYADWLFVYVPPR